MVDLDNTIFTPDRGMDESYVRELARCEWLAAEEPPPLDINHRQVRNR